MSKEIEIRLNGFIKCDDVLGFVKDKIDKNATCEAQKKYTGLLPTIPYKKYDEEDMYYITGNIKVNLGNNQEMFISYYYQNVNTEFNYISNFKSEKRKEVALNETTTVTLIDNAKNKDIANLILTKFDGCIV